MKQKCFIFMVAFLLSWVPSGFTETLCSFHGSWDVDKKEVALAFDLAQGGRVDFKGKEESPQVIDFYIDLKELKFLLFDITTQMIGTAKMLEPLGPYPSIEGALTGGEEMSAEENISHFVKGKFRLKDNKVFFENCVWAGLEVQGYWSLVSPYEVDLSVDAQHVLLVDLFSWLGQEENYAQGEVSGQVHFSGILDYLAIKGKFFSSGQIGDFRYDSIAANFEGFYPIVKLTDTSVTQEDGASFFLEGNVDLSKDFKKFSEQLAKMKMLPLIRQTDVDREWTIRRETEDSKTGATEFKYRLRKEREVSGLEEGGTLTIQHSIKF
jgi:hypothetical protein